MSDRIKKIIEDATALCNFCKANKYPQECSNEFMELTLLVDRLDTVLREYYANKGPWLETHDPVYVVYNDFEHYIDSIWTSSESANKRLTFLKDFKVIPWKTNMLAP